VGWLDCGRVVDAAVTTGVVMVPGRRGIERRQR
jgi:hypothetical protein